MSLLLQVSDWIKLASGHLRPSNESQRRYTRIVQSGITGLASKGTTALVGVISIPLALKYLGQERFGIWVSLSTLLTWIQLADLGLGNGLTTAVSEGLAHQRLDQVRTDVATTFWLLAAIAVAAGGVFAVLAPWIDWAAVFNVRSVEVQAELRLAVPTAVGIALLRFPLSSVDKIYQAHQETAIANLFSAGSSLAGLGAIILVSQTHGGLFALVVAFFGAQAVVTVLSAAWIIGHRYPHLLPTIRAFSWARAHQLTSQGGLFFLVQVNVLLVFQTDVLIVAHYLGPEQVTPYAVSYRLFSIVTLPASLLFPALWPAYVEALARGDRAWIHRTLKLSLGLGGLLSAGLAVPLVVFGLPIIRLWAGSAAVPPQSLLYWMGGWTIAAALGTSLAAFLNAANRLLGQTMYGLANSIATVSLSIVFAQRYGITGVIAALVLSYVCLGLVPTSAESYFVLRWKLPTRAPDQDRQPPLK